MAVGGHPIPVLVQLTATPSFFTGVGVTYSVFQQPW
jgi:hypothetical protein